MVEMGGRKRRQMTCSMTVFGGSAYVMQRMPAMPPQPGMPYKRRRLARHAAVSVSSGGTMYT
jgi:hypothetical protein